MKNKKVMRKARLLRPCLDWKDSIKVAKMVYKDGMYTEVEDYLKENGYTLDSKIESYCQNDGGANGFYTITNTKGKTIASLKFSCCGLYIE